MFNYEMPSKEMGLKKCFCTKIFFFNIFYSFNPNHAYWNQRRLFSGNLPGMFDFSRLVSLFSHSAKSYFEHQLLSKAIQNEQSQYKKLKSEVETG